MLKIYLDSMHTALLQPLPPCLQQLINANVFVTIYRSAAADIERSAAAECVMSQVPLKSIAVAVVPAANVVRGGKRISVESDQLVPGDVVAIKSGDRIPADLRLIEVTNLQVRC